MTPSMVMAATTRIALFGGTFDPVHKGHLAMATAARESMKLDQVRFLPCRVSPHKQDQPPTLGQQRLEMLELATQESEWAHVDDHELHQPQPSYSWATAEAMSARFPESQLYWIMGSDQWLALERWDQPKRLAACVEFIVFHRGEEPKRREGYTLHSLPAIHPANATMIRKALAQEISGHPWLHSDVAEYIGKNKLYRPTA